MFRRTWLLEPFNVSCSNAHAYRLYFVKESQEAQQQLSATTFFLQTLPRSAEPRIMTQFCASCQNLLKFLSEDFDQASLLYRKANPFSTAGREGAQHNNSLTMTYFHTGICTIIGAKSFHCPVRDGKEWYQLAMVVRHNLLPG